MNKWDNKEYIREYKRRWARRRRKLGLPTGGKASKEWWKKYNKEYYSRPEVKARKAKRMQEYRKNPELRFKMKARRLARTAIEQGKLFKQNCVYCDNPDSQKHHPDYTKPLLVVWLCKSCHQKEQAKAEGK